MDPDTCEKLDVERICTDPGAVVLRLPMVYGEYDPRRREEFVLGRLRAGRRRVPVGDGSWLWSRIWVDDVAAAIGCLLERGARSGVFNLAETETWSILEWGRRIAAAAGQSVEWVRVPDELLPEDLEITAARTQHLLIDAARARSELGWRPTDPAVAQPEPRPQIRDLSRLRRSLQRAQK